VIVDVLKDEVECFSRTDVGVKRSHNQDSLGVSLARTDAVWNRRGHLFTVADVMGAHAVGELASKMAVQSIEHTYPRLKEDDPAAALRTTFTLTNEVVHTKGMQNLEFRGMGTTATSLALLPDGAYVCHVGDSRCYRIRSDDIDQLTFDHSLQWELARQRQVAPEELGHIPSNVIVRSLGPQPEVKADVGGPYSVEPGDRFLLCSDGLSGPVKDDELWAAVTTLPGEEACQFLVDLANLRGGLDNITLLLVECGKQIPGRPATPRPRRFLKGLFRLAAKAPSEWWWFLAGMAFAGVGAALLRWGNWQLNLWVLTAALLLLGVALGTSVRRRRKLESKRSQKEQTPDSTAPIHRSRSCKIDKSLIDMVAKEEQRLRELAIEQSWRVAWDELSPVHDKAEKSLAEGDLPAAFREYCRAVSILSLGLRKHQDKHEVLIPHWDRRQK
jgi:serine/threonine protein phosphatase PrpC